MKNKKLFYGLLMVLVLATTGIFIWKSSVEKVTVIKPQLGGEGEIKVAVTVSGYVISGGNTTPEGLFDAPRKFVYTIQKDDSSSTNVSYTAYSPSPVDGRERKKIRLNFHAGTIKIGDYLKARGIYDAKTNVLTVANEGDYIETYSEKQ